MPTGTETTEQAEITEREGTLLVQRTVLGKRDDDPPKKIRIRPFVTATANVSVKFGATIPTVEYGNVRVDVMLSVPCYKEEILTVYKQTRDIVDKLIDAETARLTGEGIDG
jgi:hypothetical protein